jgi:hypothetical protein
MILMAIGTFRRHRIKNTGTEECAGKDFSGGKEF